MIYQEIILDHYKNPIGRGLQEPFTKETTQYNPTCGDQVHLRILIAEGKVLAVSHETEGCLISQASASVLTEQVTELTVEAAKSAIESFLQMFNGKSPENLLDDALAFQGIQNYPARINCAILPWKALQKSLGDK
jgi:nitrogen fixation NifU-like protein